MSVTFNDITMFPRLGKIRNRREVEIVINTLNRYRNH